MLWIACLLAIRNQRILDSYQARQHDDARRAAASLPPRTRKRRRTSLAALAAAPPAPRHGPKPDITPGRRRPSTPRNRHER